jgi:hypothetical protein
MSNFSNLGCLELLLLFLTLFSVKVGGGGGGGGGLSGDPNFFFLFFSWVEMSLHVEFQPSRLPRNAITLLNPI